MELEKHTAQVTKKSITSNSRRKSVTTETALSTVQNALEVICKVLSTNALSRLYSMTSERDTFVGLFLKPVYLFMESEITMKTLRLDIYKVISLSVKHFNQRQNVKTAIMQLLIYFDHLPEYLAEFLQILWEQYDHSLLAEEVLKEISSREFNANDTKGPKLVSIFLVKLSEVAGRLLLKQLAVVVKFLDGESFTLRCAVIEAAGKVFLDIARKEEDMERHRSQINSLFDLFMERTLDINPYCRCKALQALTNAMELKYKFTKRRPKITQIAVQALRDKSSLVRRKAIKLVSCLIGTHPFGQLHGTQLTLSEWQKRKDVVQVEFDQIMPPNMRDPTSPPPDTEMPDIPEEKSNSESESESDSGSENDKTDSEAEMLEAVKDTQQATDDLIARAEDSEKINRLSLTLKYYNEAIQFIEKIHEGIGYTQQLLNSKNKLEIIDSMELVVLADAYGIEVARQGVRSMIHLVWAKGNNDEAKAIQQHLVICYRKLFFEAPSNLTQNDAALVVARSLVSLTYGATLAEITSLERLLCLAMEERDLITPLVINMLWKLYCTPDGSKSQRRGSIIVLGMLARADHAIALAGVDHIIQIGLGEMGKQDMVLAKYSCIALQHSVAENEYGRKKSSLEEPKKITGNHEVAQKLMNLIMMPSGSIEWFGVAEQAINAIFDICEAPDEVMAKVIKVKTNQVIFTERENSESNLGQLIFIVGHIALKTLVFLEKTEIQFKTAKQKQQQKTAGPNSEQDDMELIGGGTSEDDYTEAVAYIREREMLYGENAILSKFAPMVSALGRDILDGRRSKFINIAGMVCLAKFMAVSAKYCEDNLPILMTMLDRFDDPIIRSNAVLALGDIAVSFNHIMDDNTEFLYKRLHDENPMVQRTCLMTLTFLILAGQVKVKEQLGEMTKCLVDEDSRISDLAKMFFLELSTKDNAIYNSFIDVFSTLVSDDNLEMSDFKAIFKFLTPLVEKEKYVKQLSEKLFLRLVKSETKHSWDCTVFVLGLFPHKNEEITKVITEGFKHFVKDSKNDDAQAGRGRTPLDEDEADLEYDEIDV